METYLPSPLNFLYWDKIKQSFKKRKVSNPPYCIELNITGKKGYNSYFEEDLDIFTLERILREIKNLEIEWLVMGYKNDVFLHKSINSFFKILKNLNLKIFSLQTNGLYLNRVDLECILTLIKGRIFIKRKDNMKSYENIIFKENLLKIFKTKREKNYLKPEVFLLEEDYDLNEKREFEEKGALFLKNFLFCSPELYPYLPFFFLSIENNGFCYVSEIFQEPVGTIFFNSLSKIWNSRKLKNLRHIHNKKGILALVDKPLEEVKF